MSTNPETEMHLGEENQGIVQNLVEKAETKGLSELLQWLTDSERRADKCKCPSCKKEAAIASRAFYAELHRLAENNPKDPDEEALAQYALAKADDHLLKKTRKHL